MKYGPHELRKLAEDVRDDKKEIEGGHLKKGKEELISCYQHLLHAINVTRQHLEKAGYGK